MKDYWVLERFLSHIYPAEPFKLYPIEWTHQNSVYTQILWLAHIRVHLFFSLYRIIDCFISYFLAEPIFKHVCITT